MSISKVENLAPYSRNDDADWNEIVTFYALAHPELTPAQQEMIKKEYFPGASARQLNARRCLAAYIIQDLRIAVDTVKQKPPDYQLFLPDAKKLKLIFEP